ncbi:hypothetical protein ACQPX6_22690 [Actinomycetospora sp. CA-101289]|uniref:hypothetical protein n=1 Tax=Actinomycetospora sp. CA-101289 TaxID=3239893 RepID=UPI003D954E9C
MNAQERGPDPRHETHTSLAWALAPTAVLLAVVAVILSVVLRRPAPWQETAGT